MIDAATYQRIKNLREMAIQVVQEADEVMARLKNTPGISMPSSSKEGGLTASQKAKLLRKRRANVARSLVRGSNQKTTK